MDRAVRAAMAAGFLASSLAVCFPASRTTSEHYLRQPTSVDQRGTASSPLAVTVIQPQQTPEQAKEEDAERDEKRSNDRKTVALTERIANLTLWLAVIGGIQALIFVLQLIAFAFQAKRLKQTIDSVELTERAYIFADVQFTVFDAGLLLADENKGTVHAVVNFSNYGKTPAVISLIRAYTELSADAPQALLETERSDIPLPPSLGVKADASYSIDLHHRFTVHELGEAQRLEKSIYFVGKMEYSDVTGKPCTTSFCWQLVLQEGRATYATVTRGSKLNKHM